jgi:hypothetical protein
MIEIVRDHAGRVKRWSSGEMALRSSCSTRACSDTRSLLHSRPTPEGEPVRCRHRLQDGQHLLERIERANLLVPLDV